MDARTIKRIADHPAEFRKHLVIDANGAPALLAERMDPWQAADFSAMDAGLRRIAGRSTVDACKRFYLERPRGHSKTNDIAITAAWAVAFSMVRISGVVGAGDRDQARLIRNAIDKMLSLNPWLTEFLAVQADKIVGKASGSVLEIISCDAPSSYGLTCDLVICDELSHWSKPDLWDSLFSATAKRANCVLIVISNAGTGQGSSWQWRVREATRQDSGWYFVSLDGPQASWISQELLDEQRRLLPKTAFERLWLNRWSTSGGDAIDPEDLQRAVDVNLREMSGQRPGFTFSAGLDLGLAKDSSALVIVGREESTGRFHLAKVLRWSPTKERRIDLTEVETVIKREHSLFRWQKAFADPWQGDMLLTRLRQASVPFEEYCLNPAGWDTLSRTFVECFQNYRVRLFDHPRLIEELSSATTDERSNGQIKMSFPRTEHGHGDCAMAFLLALEAAKSAPKPLSFSRPMFRSLGELQAQRNGITNPDVLADIRRRSSY